MRGGARGARVETSVHVNDVGADGDVDCHGYAATESRGKDTVPPEARLTGFREKASHRLADSEAVAVAGDDGFVDDAPGLLRHVESPAAEDFRNIFGSPADQRDFEIVNQGGAVHRHRGDVTAPHQVREHRPESDLDDVPAEPPNDGLAARARGLESLNDGKKVLTCEDPWQRVRPLSDGGPTAR